MTNKAKIKEIFTSIQGEGPFIGYKQLFIRFVDAIYPANTVIQTTELLIVKTIALKNLSKLQNKVLIVILYH